MRGSEPSAGIRTQSYAAEVGDGLRRSVAGPGRRWLLVLTLLLGGLCAALIAAFAPAPSIAVLAAPVQLVMSVPVPLSGVLLVHDQRRQSDVLRPSPVVVAAVVYATGVALVGFGLCVLAVAFSPFARLGTPRTVLTVALGGVAVQVIAQLVGTGLGFHLRRTLVAFLATIVFPLGTWLLLGVLGPLGRLQQWLTPFGATPPLLTGAPTARDLAAWAVVLVLWGGLLNGTGVLRRP